MHSVALSQQKSTCVFTPHPRSHICFGQRGFGWKCRALTQSFIYSLCLVFSELCPSFLHDEELWPSSCNLSSISNFYSHVYGPTSKQDWQVSSITVRMNKTVKHRERRTPCLSSALSTRWLWAAGLLCVTQLPHGHTPCYPTLLWTSLTSGLRDLLPNCPSTHSHHVGQRPQTWCWKCLK